MISRVLFGLRSCIHNEAVVIEAPKCWTQCYNRRIRMFGVLEIKSWRCDVCGFSMVFSVLMVSQSWGLASTCPNGILEQCLATLSIARWRSQQLCFICFCEASNLFDLVLVCHAQVLQLTIWPCDSCFSPKVGPTQNDSKNKKNEIFVDILERISVGTWDGEEWVRDYADIDTWHILG